MRKLLLIGVMLGLAKVAMATPNAYMVENTTGSSPTGAACYEFQTRPTCSAFINGLVIGPGSTNYIQDTFSPTTTTQVFSVLAGTATGSFTSSAFTIISTGTSPGSVGTTSGHPISFLVGATEAMFVSTDSRIGIGGPPDPVNKGEKFHVEGNTSPQPGGVGAIDVFVGNRGTSSARFLTQSNMSASIGPGLNIVSYLGSAGSGDAGSWWSGGPAVANSNFMQFQNGSSTVFEFFGTAITNTDVYWWNQNSTSSWHWNTGTNGREQFTITDSSITARENLVISSPVWAGGTPGTAGQLLRSNGAGLNPSWASGQRILQVVSSTIAASAASTSASYADTNLTATITPSAVTSTIFILVVQTFEHGGLGDQTGWQLLRGAGVINGPFTADFDATSTQIDYATTMIYLDSPATTSATTYKTQFARIAGSTTITANPSLSPASQKAIYLIELGQ